MLGYEGNTVDKKVGAEGALVEAIDGSFVGMYVES